MFGWRSKFLLALIIYFAGFATAIYTLAPAIDKDGQLTLSIGQFEIDKDQITARTQQLAQATKTGFEKFKSFAEEHAATAGQAIKARMAERQEN